MIILEHRRNKNDKLFYYINKYIAKNKEFYKEDEVRQISVNTEGLSLLKQVRELRIRNDNYKEHGYSYINCRRVESV